MLVTLGYLALQVRHAREQMSRGVRGARSEALRQLLALNVTLPELRLAQDKLDERLGVAPSAWTAFVPEHGGTRDEANLLNLGEWYRWSLVEQTLANAEDLALAERAQAERTYRGIYGADGASAHEHREDNVGFPRLLVVRT